MRLFGKPKPARRRSLKVSHESLDLQRKRLAQRELERQWLEGDADTRKQMMCQILNIRLRPAASKTVEEAVEEALANDQGVAGSRGYPASSNSGNSNFLGGTITGAGNMIKPSVLSGHMGNH